MGKSKPCTRCGGKRRKGDSKCGVCRDALDAATAERIRSNPKLKALFADELTKLVAETKLSRADILYLGVSSRGPAAQARYELARRLYAAGLSKRAVALAMGCSEQVVNKATNRQGATA